MKKFSLRNWILESGMKITRNKVWLYLKEIERINSLSLKEQKEYQKNKLKKILLHAYNNVPYYKRIFEKNSLIKNKNVNLKNFSKIPILTKNIIRKEGSKLYSKDYKTRKPYENSSGGSTGEPIRFIQDKNYSDWNIANKIWYKTLAGQKIGFPEARLWGSERDIIEGKENLKIRIRNFIYNRKELNAFRMSEKNCFYFYREMQKFKPSWIEAYVQSIYEFTNFLKKKKLEFKNLKGILTSAGTLYPEVKKEISTTFNCPVFNRYGSREVGDMACSDLTKKGLFISHWNNLIEIIDQKVIVTNLNNFSMPLIRYQIGDIAKKGKNWKYLENIKGREVNIFKTKTGEKIDGEYFTHLFYLKDWVKKFQVIQEDYLTIKIKVIKNKNPNNKDIIKIEEDIRVVMGENCIIKWSFVKNINHLKNGKYLYTISKIR